MPMNIRGASTCFKMLPPLAHLFLNVLELGVEQLDEHRYSTRLDHKFRLLRRSGGDVGQRPRRFELHRNTDVNEVKKKKKKKMRSDERYLQGGTAAVTFTCNVQSVLFSRNSTNLLTTPGVPITSSMGGFGSEKQQIRNCLV